ncbi:hypothetical protein ENSA5_20830 [Enhygromyxa salina]|uniref:Transmembrane protein n=1 Tax=Enhygromyxa salina TaxID=215803 RepID=A0A2S9YCG1_9BACT|nr:DUF3556 domain-containing protein [Enhygromyxa salina]PRQ02818.1 hypothetical protein ENSA5_20830 [Enhygromyxa salina]
MGLLDPQPPPYDPLEWERQPFGERARQACQAWAIQGYGTPIAVYSVYAIKVAFYVGMWALFCSFTPGLGDLRTISTWWLDPIAFQKAIVWSLLFEMLGLGCGSGPLTARYMPPVGGFLYFLRPGTTKLPMFEGAPLIGGTRRTAVDATLYAAALWLAIWTLVSPQILPEQLLALVVVMPLLGVLDKTLFLIARGEHYWTTLVVFAFAGNWIAGAKAVQLALWFWAGFSKLNHHFASVVCVMTSNSPFTRFRWLRERMYRSYPDDLRPSKLAAIMAHAGTALELGVPLILLFAPGGTWLIVGMVLMLMLHGYITSNVPMGVPIEWNVMVVYGGFALFWAHPEVTILDTEPPALAVFLIVMLVVLPLLGNLVPRAVSFLVAMRYYAGNWPYSVWLFRGESYRKLDSLVKSSGWVHDQLALFYDRKTAVGLVSKVLAFRMMHLHGRALPVLLPRAVENIEDYEYAEGEVIAGLVLGWNFGEGHLHQDQLLRAVQEQCEFEAGELRCVFVEAQPFGRGTQEWRVVDAKAGLIDHGELSVSEMRSRQPWEPG